ncbi:group II intron maturase-specific domain-containing protein [Streptomyces sp. NPDC052036]|uniref:group II intron maturase-specific domain-containing protein n=1 Tax=Streptomyces sp. NPDC052036 TaxID=3155171 RepID=UPI003442B569
MYCKDGKRRGSYEHVSFTFLGYTFRSRKVRSKTGSYFFGFNPAISDEAAKRSRAQIRRWRLHQRSGSSLADLAREISPIVRGYRPHLSHGTSRGRCMIRARSCWMWRSR